MTLPITAVVVSLVLLTWSAGRFVEGAACTARHFDMPPLLVGMLVVGFGTSAPEMVVSVLAAFQGSGGISLGNAFGSNITNIALILGLSALIFPITFQSSILKKELPILTLVTAVCAILLLDSRLDRIDAGLLLTCFVSLVAWSIHQSRRKVSDPLAKGVERILDDHLMPIRRAIFWLVVGLDANPSVSPPCLGSRHNRRSV